MTLVLWKAPVVDDAREAQAVLTPYFEAEDESGFEPSADLARVTDELFRLYPYSGSEDSPWSDPPSISDRVVSLDIRWGADDAVLDVILDLAREHELVLYDPQGPDVHCPPWVPDNPPPISSQSAGEYLRLLAAGTVGVLLVIGGWVASIPVLSWVVIAVGVFVVGVVALFLFLAIRDLVVGRPAD